MKKITLVLPALAAALLATTACTKTDDVANNTTISDVTSNGVVISDGNSLDTNGTGTDDVSNISAEPDNAFVTLGNSQ